MNQTVLVLMLSQDRLSPRLFGALSFDVDLWPEGSTQDDEGRRMRLVLLTTLVE